MTQNFLVAGAAGFIGSNLCEFLLKGRDIKVMGFDNLETGNSQNLSDLLKNPRFTFIEGDCRKFTEISKVLRGCDVVYHLAASADVRAGLCESSRDFESNVIATRNLLEVIKQQKEIKQLIFTSTSTVYGEPDVLPTPETYGSIQPISLYGASKLACEALISAYSSLFEFKSTIFRLANVLGPRLSHGVVYDFVNKLRKDPTKLEILGDGTQNKSYVSIDDCLNGFIVGAQATGKNFEVFNLGSEDRIDVLKIADIVEEEMNLAGKVKRFVPNTRSDGRGWGGDVKEMILDITKLKSKGWKPASSSAEAVRFATRSLAANIRYSEERQITTGTQALMQALT